MSAQRVILKAKHLLSSCACMKLTTRYEHHVGVDVLSRPAVLLDAVVTFNKNNTKREKIFYLIITNTYIYIYTHSYFITLLLDKTLYTFTLSTVRSM